MIHLLTGGSGYLGVAIARALAHEGEQIRIYDLTRSERLPAGIQFVEGDVCDCERLGDAMCGCDIVHHLVGIMPQARAPHTIMQAVNVRGTENVVRAASEQGVRRVVFVSSSEVYGRPGVIPITEDHPRDPIGEYGRNKMAAEELCQEYRKTKGLEVVILRPPTIVGPEMTERTFLRNMDMARKGRFFCVGAGSHHFQMAFVDDVAEACVLAASKEGINGEVFNIGSVGTLPFKRLLEEVARHLGHNPKIRSIPAGIFKSIIRLLYPLGLSPIELDHLHLFDTDFVMDVSKAQRMLGWQPTRTDLEMLIETYEWHESTFEHSEK